MAHHGSAGGRVAGSASGTDLDVGAAVRWSPEVGLGRVCLSLAVEALELGTDQCGPSMQASPSSALETWLL